MAKRRERTASLGKLAPPDPRGVFANGQWLKAEQIELGARLNMLSYDLLGTSDEEHWQNDPTYFAPRKRRGHQDT